MVGFIIVLVFVVLVWAWLSSTMKKNKREHAANVARDQQREVERNAALNAQDDFFGEARAEWPLQTPIRSKGRAMLMATQHVSRLRLQYFENEGAFEAGAIREFDVKALRTVEIRETFRTRKVEKVDHVPISFSNNRSSVGRAVAGGLIAGPTGAMVGAASGLGGKHKIEHKKVTTYEERQERAPAMLVLGVNDIENPLVKIHFEADGEADTWRHRIDMARQRR